MLQENAVLAIRKEIDATGYELHQVFHALSDANRLRIFRILLQHEEICVTDLSNILEVSLSAVSQHLRVLEMNGLVTKQRYGQTICYQINESDEFVQRLMPIMDETYYQS